ncbi:protein NRT1/ PTR FAMILY 7.3-like [Iris pallida]|uniref:Protein NRT1/ PTR FAMILY 7.3-like n=1 Tax=Iris pallida TaxID=29817 RepID=A0AAX6EAW2_IRIPA|nr:protein NRT1/ PTR FAMILY 7.3-like [Iris pallida]KAJ6805676.1 protein NRT1/ PTR FAMILY 7.3-like [Iris pallida]
MVQSQMGRSRSRHLSSSTWVTVHRRHGSRRDGCAWSSTSSLWSISAARSKNLASDCH